MNGLEVLNEDFIKLLQNHKLLRPLIKSQLTKNILEKVNIEKNIEEKTLNTFMQKYGVTDQKILEEWIKSNNISKEEMHYMALKDIRLKKYCKTNFEHQVESRFLERKNNLDIFVYSLIRIKDAYKAKELFMRLICKEENFDDLAYQHSDGPEKITRGIVGPTSIESAHPQLAKAIRIGKIGEIMPPIQIESKDGMVYLIVRLEFHEPAKLDEFMREKMALEIFDKSLDEEVNNYLLNSTSKAVKNENIGEAQ